jgi:hypothetical protein
MNTNYTVGQTLLPVSQMHVSLHVGVHVGLHILCRKNFRGNQNTVQRCAKKILKVQALFES